MGIYIKFDENGEYGFYSPEIHEEEFCENECVEIKEDFYNFLLENQGEYLVDVATVTDTVDMTNLKERPPEVLNEGTPTNEERLKALEQAMLEIVLGGI